MPRQALRNPQTVQLLAMLGLDYNLEHARGGAIQPPPPGLAGPPIVASNPEEIDIDDGADDEEPVTNDVNPEEIDIDDDDDDVQVDSALAAVLGGGDYNAS